MRYGQCVGRVGGLAAALGVGIAIWLGCPTATADDAAGSTSGTSNADSGRQAPSSPPRRGIVASRHTKRDAAADTHEGTRRFTRHTFGAASHAPDRAAEVEASDANENPLAARGTRSLRLVQSRTSPNSPAPGIPSTPVDSPLGTTLLALGSRTRDDRLDGATAHRLTFSAATTTSQGALEELDGQASTGGGVTAIGGVTLTGQRPGSVLVSADGTRAVMVTAWPRGRVTLGSYPDGVRGSTTRVAVIDTATGRQVGTTFRTTGTHPAVVQLTADSSRAMVTSVDSKTHVAVINIKTGIQVGSTVTLSGGGSAQLTGDSRALVTTNYSSLFRPTPTMGAAVLDLGRGIRLGSPITLAGVGYAELSPDKSHALLFTTSAVASVDMRTGARVGPGLSGSWGVEAWSADGTRALLSGRDGDGTSFTTRVASLDVGTGTQVGTTLSVVGSGAVQYNAAVNRAAVSTSTTTAAGITTRVALFDTSGGVQRGTTLTVAGEGSLTFSPSGGRVLMSVDRLDPAAGTHSAEVKVLDTVSGTQVGSLTLTGNPLVPIFSPDGTRAVIATDVYDPATTLHTSQVTMLNATTGAQLGTTLTLVGSNIAEAIWRADGTRALVTMTSTQYDSVASPMLVAVVDSAGNQVGTTLSLSGMPGYGERPVWSPDGTRAVITTNDYDQVTGLNTVRVTAINTTAGGQVGSTVTLTGSAYGSRTVMIPGTTRALVTAGEHLAVINTATGTQVGPTIAFDGTPTVSLLSSDGTRALINVGNIFTVIDTTAATRIGPDTTLTYSDARMINAQLTPDGTHALITTTRQSYAGTGVPASPVAVIDLPTGTQAGPTLILDGDVITSPVFTPDGTHATISTVYYDNATGVSATEVTTVDPRTGARIGDPVALSGVISSGIGNPTAMLSSPDGTRALLATTSPSRYNTGQITVVDTATGKQVGNVVAIDGGITGLKWSADGTRVVVTSIILTTTGADQGIRVTVLDAS